MKNLTFILLVLTNMTCRAQYPVTSTTSLANPAQRFDHPNKGNYAIDTNNERQQYLGLWRYNQNGILFEIKIELANQKISLIENLSTNYLMYSYCDEVIIKYKLVKNNEPFYDNLDSTDSSQILSYGYKLGENTYLHGQFLDYTRNVVAHFNITKLTGVPEKIIFDLSEGVYYLRELPEYYENSGLPLFTVPIEPIAMLKVN